MEKIFCVVGGIQVTKTWKLAEGCNTPSKLSSFIAKEKNAIITVEDDKAKLYQKDENDVWHYLIWQLSTNNPKVETEQILLASFFSSAENKPKFKWQTISAALEKKRKNRVAPPFNPSDSLQRVMA